MKFSILLIAILFWSSSFAQDDVKRNVYYGNIAYHNENFDEAMTHYEKAIVESPFNYNANYNMANTYFKLEAYDKAIEKYESLLNQTNDISKKSMLHHNIGNCNLVNNKLDDAIESYKESLRLMPNAESTRYNLAFALELKKQQQQQKEEQQEKQEGDSENNSDNNQNGSESDGNEDNSDQNSNQDEQEEKEEQQDSQEESEENNEESEDNQNSESQQKEEGDKSSESRKNAYKILEEANKREKEIQEMMIANKGKKNSNKKNTSTTKKDW